MKSLKAVRNVVAPGAFLTFLAPATAAATSFEPVTEWYTDDVCC